ncbi:hypothetical protein [Stappia albiluteola]|nr:hypothetical protein [Stappia albiluteola]
MATAEKFEADDSGKRIARQAKNTVLPMVPNNIGLPGFIATFQA